MKTAIMGATGHVAKCALWVFAQQPDAEVYLFSRSREKLPALERQFPEARIHCIQDYTGFPQYDYDVIVNGIGVWDTPGASANQIFAVTERYDQMVLDYQFRHPETVSIHISSGAVYGGSFSEPVREGTKAMLAVNQVSVGDYYAAAKLNAEIKHRAFPDLRIVDLRLFGFFSRYMSLEYRYLLSGMIRSVQRGTVFKAVPGNFYRDYIHLSDFSRLLLGIAARDRINTAIDVRSREPVSKEQLLSFFVREYGLRAEPDTSVAISRTGLKPYYYSERENEIYVPQFTSMETVEAEARFFLKGGLE